MKLSIIIISYNCKEYLEQTLKSVFATAQKLPKSHFEVIVVDNNSDDGVVGMIEKHFPQVKLIASKVNLGFGGGNNEGAKKACGDYLLLLNPDTIILDNSIQKIIETIETHPEVGIFTPKVVLEDQETVQSGLINYKPVVSKMILEKPFKRFKTFVKKKPFLRKLALKVSLDFWNFNEELVVDWVSGAVLVIKKDLFDKLEGFDEKLFMYFEDVDLCLRAKKLAAKIMYYPVAKIVHIGGKSIAQSRDRKKLFYRSQDYFWSKHYSLMNNLLLKIIRLPYRVFNLLFAK